MSRQDVTFSTLQSSSKVLPEVTQAAVHQDTGSLRNSDKQSLHNQSSRKKSHRLNFMPLAHLMPGLLGRLHRRRDVMFKVKNGINGTPNH